MIYERTHVDVFTAKEQGHKLCYLIDRRENASQAKRWSCCSTFGDVKPAMVF